MRTNHVGVGLGLWGDFLGMQDVEEGVFLFDLDTRTLNLN